MSKVIFDTDYNPIHVVNEADLDWLQIVGKVDDDQVATKYWDGNLNAGY